MLLLVNYKPLRPLFSVTLNLLTNKCIALGCRYEVLRKIVCPFCPDITLDTCITQCNTCTHSLSCIKYGPFINRIFCAINHNVQPCHLLDDKWCIKGAYQLSRLFLPSNAHFTFPVITIIFKYCLGSNVLT